MNKQELYKLAFQTINHRKFEKYGECGQVACALETVDGDIFTGICIDLPCSIGFCAEQAAMADMLKHGKTQIKQIIAVFENGNIWPPCGRCREFMFQINSKNLNTTVIMPEFKEMTLQELLPYRWTDYD